MPDDTLVSVHRVGNGVGVILTIRRRVINYTDWVFVAREEDDPYVYPDLDVLHFCGYPTPHPSLARMTKKRRMAVYEHNDPDEIGYPPPALCEAMIVGTRCCDRHEDLRGSYELGRYIELDPPVLSPTAPWSTC